MVSDNPQIGNITLDSAGIAMDDIWTYERAEGRRILFPWQAEGLPPGTLQMDIVFGEKLFADPVATLMTLTGNSDTIVWSASKELSLAWKLLWLETDSYPQGKDLYDATLLAQHTQLPFELLRQVLESHEDWKYDFEHHRGNLSWKSGFPWFMEPYYIEWDDFKREHPWVEGEAKDWVAKLSQALAPTFANL